MAPWPTSASGLLAGAPAWLSGLVVDGIIGGAGTVITFLPILVIFFAVLALLEDMGYMARAAYVMDRFMHLMGLHGKSFLPLFLGFGCNVPAVMGTRIIDSRRARLLTILLAPLVPCAARMAVIVFITPIFFGRRCYFGGLGLDRHVPGRAGGGGRAGQPVGPQGRAGSLYHGAAPLPSSQYPDHRHPGLAERESNFLERPVR